VSFANASELVEALAVSQEARTCYAMKWLAFAYGHELDATDAPTVMGLSNAPLGATELMTKIASSDLMLERLPNEVAP
jgi:hypothetical protein